MLLIFICFFFLLFFLHINKQTHTAVQQTQQVSFRFVSRRFRSFSTAWSFFSWRGQALRACSQFPRGSFYIYTLQILIFLPFYFFFFTSFFFFNKPWNEFLKEEGGKNLQVLNRFYKIILINFARILIIIEIIESLQDCTIEKIIFPNILVSSQNSPVHDFERTRFEEFKVGIAWDTVKHLPLSYIITYF